MTAVIVMLFVLVLLLATANWELLRIRRALESRSDRQGDK